MRKLYLFFTLIPLIFLITFSFSLNYPINIGAYNNKQIEIRITIYYIFGNAQLQSKASSGTGTSGDPYIIKDLIINGGGSPNFGIYIEQTTAYFILRNCTAFNSEQAITLDTVVNGKIENCTARNSNYGIIVQNSQNCLLYNNTVHSISKNGIYLYGSDRINVSRNFIHDTSWSGISVYTGKFNRLSHNMLSNAGDAIYMDHSNNTSVFHNTISFSNYGINAHSSGFNQIIDNNATGNSVGIVIDTTSTGCRIIRNNVSDNFWGLQVSWSNKTSLLNNTANYNDYDGFDITSADFLNLTFNSANYNGEYGFYLKSTSGINFTNNHAINNSKTGLLLEGCYFSNFSKNIINNNSCGIQLKYFHDNTIEWNILHFNTKGIQQDYTCYANIIRNNDIRNRDNYYNPILTEGKVTPIKGNTSTVFRYTVIYTDLDNNPPAMINIVINGTAHAMQKQNSSDIIYTDGCIYIYSTNLSIGQHNYYFEANDSVFSVRTPTSGVYLGPNVSEPNNPSIPGFSWSFTIFGLIAFYFLFFYIQIKKELSLKELKHTRKKIALDLYNQK